MLATTAPQLDSVGRSSVPAAANTWKLSRWCPGCRCRRTAARSRCRTPSSPSSWSQSSRLREWILVWPPRSTFVGDRSVLIWSGGKIEILNWYLNYWTGSVFTLPVCKIFSLFPSAYKLYYCKELLVTVKFFLFLQHQHEVVAKAGLHHHPVHGACTGKMEDWENWDNIARLFWLWSVSALWNLLPNSMSTWAQLTWKVDVCGQEHDVFPLQRGYWLVDLHKVGHHLQQTGYHWTRWTNILNLV